MDNFKSFESLLQSVNEKSFTDIALRLFHYQAKHNPVYASYIQHLKVNTDSVNNLAEIPFLPISFFKTHSLKSGTWEEEAVFTSSGTTGMATSSHSIANVGFFHRHANRCFEKFFGPLDQYHILAIMPSYLERQNSSLIAMMNYFIKQTRSADSGFYLYNYEKLLLDIERLRKGSIKKILVWGVSFALLDIAEKFHPDLSGCLVFETGGMKGRRKEVTRDQLHARLKEEMNLEAVYSEYGMTELMSQAYTRGGNLFCQSDSMRVLVREVLDPFNKSLLERTGGLNIIDLANFHSVAFIETEDAGKVFQDGSFEVMGRLDNSDIRGCNLLVE